MLALALPAASHAVGPRGAAEGAPPPSLERAAAACVPPLAERRGAHYYGFGGVHYIRPLRAWLYEVPKSGSTTLVGFFGLRNGACASVPPNGPAQGDVAFAVARQPVERAISAYHTAYARAAWRANSSGSACPYARFPYLQANISDSAGLSAAVAVLAAHGSALAGAGCGFAYHHLLSQSWFLWRERVRLLYSKRLPRGARATDAQLPPPVTVVLRLERLAEDLATLCAARNATAFCDRRARELGGIRPLNPSRKAAVSAHAWRQAQAYYAPDFECLGYPRTLRG